MRVYVLTPDYTHQSMGVASLHYLMYLMSILGFEISTNCSVFNPKYPGKYITKPFARSEQDRLIVPEIIDVSPLYPGDIPIFRWVLYFPGKLGGPIHYGKNECVYHWCEDYRQSAEKASYNGTSKEFWLPPFNSEEYTDTNADRSGDLVFVYKGRNMGGHPPEAYEITKDNTPKREDLLTLLRTHSILYSYDRYSGINTEAAMSGMTVKLWNYDSSIWEDYTYVPGMNEFKDTSLDVRRVRAVMADFDEFTRLADVDTI